MELDQAADLFVQSIRVRGSSPDFADMDEIFTDSRESSNDIFADHQRSTRASSVLSADGLRETVLFGFTDAAKTAHQIINSKSYSKAISFLEFYERISQPGFINVKLILMLLVDISMNRDDNFMQRLFLFEQLNNKNPKEIFVVYKISGNDEESYAQYVNDKRYLESIRDISVTIVAVVDPDMNLVAPNAILNWIKLSCQRGLPPSDSLHLLYLMYITSVQELVEVVQQLANFPQPIALRMIHHVSTKKFGYSSDSIVRDTGFLLLSLKISHFLRDVMTSAVWGNRYFFDVKSSFMMLSKPSVFYAAQKTLKPNDRMTLYKEVMLKDSQKANMMLPDLSPTVHELTELLVIAMNHLKVDIFTALLKTFDAKSEGRTWKPAEFWQKASGSLNIQNSGIFANIYWGYMDRLPIDADQYFINLPIQLQYLFLQNTGTQNLSAACTRTRTPELKAAIIKRIVQDSASDPQLAQTYYNLLSTAWYLDKLNP